MNFDDFDFITDWKMIEIAKIDMYTTKDFKIIGLKTYYRFFDGTVIDGQNFLHVA